MLIQSLILEFIEKNSCLLIEIELRRLHRRFDHLSARRLHEILHRSEHNEIEFHAIEHLIKFCHHCQMHEKSSDRFIFSIRNEVSRDVTTHNTEDCESRVLMIERSQR